MFCQMDAMIARMLEEMAQGMMAGMLPAAAGYQIIMRGSGMPQVSPYDGTIQHGDPHGPVPEIHRIGNEVKVVTELPGAEKESVHIDVSEGTITIGADCQGQHIVKRARLPPVDAASMRSSLRNGVLEVTFAGLNEPCADEKHDA
jgi:HSP20 family molecular chaperone IbpA